MWLWKLNQCEFDYTHYHYVICVYILYTACHTGIQGIQWQHNPPPLWLKFDSVSTRQLHTNNVIHTFYGHNMFPVSITYHIIYRAYISCIEQFPLTSLDINWVRIRSFYRWQIGVKSRKGEEEKYQYPTLCMRQQF